MTPRNVRTALGADFARCAEQAFQSVEFADRPRRGTTKISYSVKFEPIAPSSIGRGRSERAGSWHAFANGRDESFQRTRDRWDTTVAGTALFSAKSTGAAPIRGGILRVLERPSANP